MSDPRAENCRGFRVTDGKVTGVLLAVDERPAAQYELVRMELIDEVAAQGNTVATCEVLDKEGFQTAASVYLAWPWPNLTERALPGNQVGQHPITNGYKPDEGLGPLALYVGDAAGNVISDVVGGLGLPYNRHVSFRATWLERDPAEPGDGGDGGDGEVVGLLLRIAEGIERLVRHLGA